MSNEIRVDGLRELDRALAALQDEVAGKKAMRGALFDAMRPVFVDARNNASAPSFRHSGALAAAMGRWFVQIGTNSFAMFVGPRSKSKEALALWAAAHRGKRPQGGRIRHGHLMEFGTYKQPAEPFLRPAFDANKTEMISIFVKRLRERIAKVAGRHG